MNKCVYFPQHNVPLRSTKHLECISWLFFFFFFLFLGIIWNLLDQIFILLIAVLLPHCHQLTACWNRDKFYSSFFDPFLLWMSWKPLFYWSDTQQRAQGQELNPGPLQWGQSLCIWNTCSTTELNGTPKWICFWLKIYNSKYGRYAWFHHSITLVVQTINREHL